MLNCKQDIKYPNDIFNIFFPKILILIEAFSCRQKKVQDVCRKSVKIMFKNIEIVCDFDSLFFSEVQSVLFYDAHKGSHIGISRYRCQEIPGTFRVCRLEGSISRIQTSGLHFETHSSAATLCRPRNKVLHLKIPRT